MDIETLVSASTKRPVMQVVFFNKDFTNTAQPPIKVEVERYSWHMVGGPNTAYLKCPATADRWEMMKLLRAPVEIYSNDGDCVWWGFVNRVTVPISEAQRMGLGLDEMYNYVNYIDGTAASDTQSISEYGQKEKIFSDYTATADEKTNKTALYLAGHKYAKPEIEFSGNSKEINIECYGWYSTLGWKHYALDDDDNPANETQIETIAATAEFISGTKVEGASGFTSNEWRDGTLTARAEIERLMNAGTDNVQPYLCYVDKNRYLNVYERNAQPAQPEYLLREDGRLVSKLGQVVPDHKCTVAKWCKPRSVPDMIGGFSAVGMFFIESAEYNASQDKTTYRAAAAYEQARLSRYIESLVSGDRGSYPGYNERTAPYIYYGSSIKYAAITMLGSTYLWNTSDSLVVPWQANPVTSYSTPNYATYFEYPWSGDYGKIKFLKHGLYFVTAAVGVSGMTAGNEFGFEFNFVNGAAYARGITDASGDGSFYMSEIFPFFHSTLTTYIFNMSLTDTEDGMTVACGELSIVYIGTR